MDKCFKKALTAGGKVLAGVTGAFAVSVAAYMPFVAADANRKFDDDCEYLMILGGDVIGADTPSPQLLARMEKAAPWLNEHPGVIAVPCGGCFRDGQKKSEAKIIADYLVANGVDESRIILEDKSTTTFENFIFALEIIKNHSGRETKETQIAFLSSSYHMHRAALIAKKCGVDDVRRVSAPTPGSAFQRYVREYFVAYEFPVRKIKEVLGK